MWSSWIPWRLFDPGKGECELGTFLFLFRVTWVLCYLDCDCLKVLHLEIEKEIETETEMEMD
jgi:hypothetical protein